MTNQKIYTLLYYINNHKPALRWIANCSDADLDMAEKACIHHNWPIRIKDMLRSINPDDVADDNYPPLDIELTVK
jgi:dihydropyrimidine dehydrogenase (NAD+) subunit PreA